jgi:hypothetical protein
LVHIRNVQYNECRIQIFHLRIHFDIDMVNFAGLYDLRILDIMSLTHLSEDTPPYCLSLQRCAQPEWTALLLHILHRFRAQSQQHVGNDSTGLGGLSTPGKSTCRCC